MTATCTLLFCVEGKKGDHHRTVLGGGGDHEFASFPRDFVGTERFERFETRGVGDVGKVGAVEYMLFVQVIDGFNMY